MGYAASEMRRLNIIMLATAVLATACGSAPTRRQSVTPLPVTPSATAAPALRPGDLTWMSGAVGPVVVYRDGSGAVIAYDVGAGRELRRGSSAFEIGLEEPSALGGFVGVPPSEASLRPAGAVAPLAGGGADALAATRAYSHDGRLAAFVEHGGSTFDGPSTIRIVDVATGADRLTLPFANPYSEQFRGVPAVVTWRDDDAGFFIIGTYPIDAPTGYATVMLDGSIRLHQLGPGDTIAPSGRAAALLDVWSMSCDYYVDSHRIRIRNLDTGRDSSVIVDTDRMLVPVEWSPSGDGFLYASYTVGPARADPWCKGERDPSTARWFLLPAAGGDPEPVPDPHGLRERWYGDRLVDVTCVDGSAPSWSDQCDSGRARVVIVGGRTVVTGEGIDVLGFVDPLSAP